MKRIVLSILAIVMCMSLLLGCGAFLPESSGVPSTSDLADTATGCRHTWERIENLNIYTAVEKCSLCGVSRMYTDPDHDFKAPIGSGFKMLRYSWDGWGIGRKEISACDLGYAVIDCLSELEETGVIVPKISDELMSDEGISDLLGDLQVTRGTVWIECPSVGIFRLNPGMTEICRVQTHLGEGEELRMTDALKELLRQAWYYHPYDYWSGSYENGTVTLRQEYKSNSAVEWVAIENIRIENVHHSENNQIKLRLRAADTKTAMVYFESYQSSDNFGDSEAPKEIALVAGEETTLEFTFGGFYNCRYWATIIIDNTKIELTIDPQGN